MGKTYKENKFPDKYKKNGYKKKKIKHAKLKPIKQTSYETDFE